VIACSEQKKEVIKTIKLAENKTTQMIHRLSLIEL